MTPRPRTTLSALAALTATTLLAGCAGLPAGPAAPTDVPTVAVDATHPNPNNAAVALPAGSIEAALDRLPELADAMQRRSGVPGLSVAVVHGGETAYAGGFGNKIIDTDSPVDEKTVFQVASLSKAVAATVVATQVSDEVVSWDTPIRQELPGFALADPWVSRNVTVADMFSHRSGLPQAAGDLLEDIGHRRGYVLDHLDQQPLNPFRSTYGYANFGLTTGAEAVAEAAGTSWSTLSKKELYGPLGMTSTSSRHRDYLAQKNRAPLHAMVKGEFRPLYERDPDPQSPAGGVSSNVVDLARWMELILAHGERDGKPFIDPDALQPMLRPEMINSKNDDVVTRGGTYGFGVNVGVQPGGRVQLSHSGAFSLGAGTAFTMLPSADVGIVTLSNGAPVGAVEALNAEFMDLVQFGYLTRDWYAAYHAALATVTAPVGDLVDAQRPQDPAAPKRLSRYTGTYRNSYYGKLKVIQRDGRLIVALGPDYGYRVRLAAWNGDTFAFVPEGENAPYGSKSSARFRLTSGGAATLQLNFFDAEGLGTWKRAG